MLVPVWKAVKHRELATDVYADPLGMKEGAKSH